MEPIDPVGAGSDEQDGPRFREAWVAVLTDGAVTTEGGEDVFVAKLRAWMDQNPDKVVPGCERVRKLIIEDGEKEGIHEAVDLPSDAQSILHEIALLLAGALMKAVQDRILERLHKIKRSQRLPFLDQAVADLGRAEDYLLDAMEPERSEWLAIVRPLRAECHRKAEQLRRNPPRQFPFFI